MQHFGRFRSEADFEPDLRVHGLDYLLCEKSPIDVTPDPMALAVPLVAFALGNHSLHWQHIATVTSRRPDVCWGREGMHPRLGHLPRGRRRPSNGFEQHGNTTLCRHFAELCFKAEIDDAIREDRYYIAALSDRFAEYATR
jgi:hypothetical protein